MGVASEMKTVCHGIKSPVHFATLFTPRLTGVSWFKSCVNLHLRAAHRVAHDLRTQAVARTRGFRDAEALLAAPLQA